MKEQIQLYWMFELEFDLEEFCTFDNNTEPFRSIHDKDKLEHNCQRWPWE